MGADHVYYVDSRQHISQSYYNGSGWVSQDLTVAAGANTPLAAPGTALASLVYSNRDTLYYFDVNGHVNEMYYTGSGSAWGNHDLTAISQTSIAAASGSALAAFLYNNAGQVYYFDKNRHIGHLYWNGQGWGSEDLTAYTHAPTPAAIGSGLNSYTDANGQLHLYYIDANQHIGHLWWTGQTWLNEDLTAQSRTSARAALGGTLTGYAEANGKAHLFHLDAQPHVAHLWSNTQNWFSEDLTALSGTSAVPSPASGLSSMAGPNGTAYVYYVDTRQHINQLGWNGQAWSNQDLTKASASQFTSNTLIYSAFATPQTALSSLLITGGNHVYFVATDGHIHQIYANGQSWTDQDLTALGSGPVVGSIGTGSALPYVREYIYGAGQVVAIENGQFGHTPVSMMGDGSKY